MFWPFSSRPAGPGALGQPAINPKITSPGTGDDNADMRIEHQHEQRPLWPGGTERGVPVITDEHGRQSSAPGMIAATWQATLFLGAATLILGLIVSFHPTSSLNVIAVLLGILMILSGIFNLIRVFDPDELHRVWLGIAGLLFIVIGVVLIRHLHLTRSLIGLFIGITWIVQGLTALIGGISGGVREGRAWWIFFGVVSLIAGIVVAVTPASSLNFLAVLVGIWFVVMGIFEIIGGLLLRRALRSGG
jgi:uncharacterized membrane protein HdeD (DUF308 family)